jgi:hypothetical protein
MRNNIEQKTIYTKRPFSRNVGLTVTCTSYAKMDNDLAILVTKSTNEGDLLYDLSLKGAPAIEKNTCGGLRWRGFTCFECITAISFNNNWRMLFAVCISQFLVSKVSHMRMYESFIDVRTDEQDKEREEISFVPRATVFFFFWLTATKKLRVLIFLFAAFKATSAIRNFRYRLFSVCRQRHSA